MAESVDFYLLWCAERGKKPEMPFSGKIMVAPRLNFTVELPWLLRESAYR